MIDRERKNEHLDDDPPPPIGGSWRNLYATVLVALAVMIVLFYLFTRAFS